MLNRSHRGTRFVTGCVAIAIATTLASTGRVSAQELPTPPPTEASTPGAPGELSQIVVTASRITRAGFDAPTPTTVLSDADILSATRPSIGEMLNDQPQFLAQGTPALTNGSTNSSATVLDLRGLGSERTLTLLDGHRFVGSNDLNSIPQSIIKRVDVVTGGASAAWGSGAVAGVVNLILNDDLEGLTVTPTAGISSRGDGIRSGVNATYGATFAGGRGHILVAGEYFRDRGLFGRGDGSRPNLNANFFTTSSGQLLLANNVNSTVASPGGVITSGALAGMEFNPNGMLSPVPLGSQTNSNSTIGGAGTSGGAFEAIAAPYHRANEYTRVTFDASDALKLSADLSYTLMWDDFADQPEEVDGAYGTTNGIAFQKNNPYLTPAEQALLASGPETFYVGKIFTGPEGEETLEYYRRTIEASVGASGNIGGSWSYDAYADHGEIRQSQGFYNQRIEANFMQAIDAVRDPATGQIVCAVALTDPNTPCRPLDLFGVGNASPAAIAYAYATSPTQVNLTQTQELTTAGGSIHGNPVATWAGPVAIASGIDYRREALILNFIDPLSASGALGSFNNSGTEGAFNVTEGFFEGAVPLLDEAHVAKIDLNAAARYSDYSTSGGIWSWKYGATTRLLDDILLRAVYSRDIRSPDIDELYTAHSQAILTVADPARNNQVTTVSDFSGGNTSLQPEVSHTLTLGGSYSPHLIPGLSMSLDYYRIDIDGAITTLSPQDIVDLCANGNKGLCSEITRDSSGQITTINSTYINLASYDTSGVDTEISYAIPLARLLPNAAGNIRLRSLTTYVAKLMVNDGVQTYSRDGVVGDVIAAFGDPASPRWRSVETMSYDNARYGVDARVRFVGGGVYDNLSPIINNSIASRTYLDLGGHLNVGNLTISANIQNAFDRAPPYVLYASPFYDESGTYFTLSFKLKIL
jgi:iron complex outermembrane receptor protein